ncbi:MAG TPA: hypothetical protein PK777_02970 [Thermoguttaceae bacterium]|nr:hypothetical protein [Thermoguttaceae bacterium]HPP51887.1 hypothetical protein [Thermoguttaceae bacterium]
MVEEHGASDFSPPGQDSFLDVLTNLVGILVILVMLVGVRAAKAPVPQEGLTPEEQKALDDLAAEQVRVQSLRSDVLRLADQINQVQEAIAVRNRERVMLATAAAAARQELEAQRAALDDKGRRQFELRHALSEAQAELDHWTKVLQQPITPTEHVEVIHHQPTPLSRTVDEHEAHFQLRRGRIVHVPMRQIVEAVAADAQSKQDKLRQLSEISEIIGPVGGFRVKYEFEKKEVMLSGPNRTGAVATVAALRYLMLLPVRAEMGETIDEALGPNSEFRRALGQFPPRRSTVTIWTYPDSFLEFRRLKEALAQEGYATAARPLPEGAPISASPAGSKSAAE